MEWRQHKEKLQKKELVEPTDSFGISTFCISIFSLPFPRQQGALNYVLQLTHCILLCSRSLLMNFLRKVYQKNWRIEIFSSHILITPPQNLLVMGQPPDPPAYSRTPWPPSSCVSDQYLSCKQPQNPYLLIPA